MSRTLIIKTSSMGDVIHNLPIVADMRRARPDMAIDWVVEEAYADLVRLHPGVDRVIPIALRRWRAEGFGKATRAERTAFREQLREQRYDLVLDTQGLIKSALVARSARVTADGIRAGFSFGLVREGMARLFYDRGYRVDKRLHAIERLRALAAAAVGYANDSLGPPQFGLRVPPQHFDWLAATGAASTYAVLLHATARAEKTWPLERWGVLVRALIDAGIVPVLLWGNAAEEATAQSLAHGPGSLNRLSAMSACVPPRMTLPEVAALLSGASAVIGVDTGLTHLAAALDVPTVGIFGATPRWRYAPYWTPRAINLGNYGELGVQPATTAVLDALVKLRVLPVPTMAGDANG